MIDWGLIFWGLVQIILITSGVIVVTALVIFLLTGRIFGIQVAVKEDESQGEVSRR